MSVLTSVLSPFVKPIFDTISEYIEDPDKKNELQAKIQSQLNNAQLQINLAQAEINLQEAKSQSFFVAGWRAALGWVCVSGLAYHFLLHEWIVWGATLYGLPIEQMPPDLEVGQLMSLVFGMLGLGGMRTFEKIKKVPTSDFKKDK